MKNQTKPLLPVTLGAGGIPYARGIRAGNWIFASGVLATDFKSGLSPEVLASRPLSGQPRWYREATCMYARAREVLQSAGADFSQVVRTDQYFPDWRTVPFFHQARREYCGNNIPPSTSILEPGLLIPDAAMSLELIAVTADHEPKPRPVYPEGLDLPATSSFAPVVIAGDFVFVAGFLAAWQEGDLGGIAPEAKVPAGHLWKGNRIQLEADYIIRKKLLPALRGAGSSLENVVKAQVYLADINDVPAFNQIWEKHFSRNIPATTFVPTLNPGFAIVDARCEINLVALVDGGASGKKTVNPPGVTPACDGHPVATQAGDLLFFSGMVAANEEGLVKEARVDSRQPYFNCSVEAQMEYLLDAAEKTCTAAGTSLANVVRIQQFHTDLSDFYPASKVWQRRLPGQPLPLSVIGVPPPLLVPECSVQLDLWVYAP
jgi:enamine deaminase RidA (YjgF/YER057c/UK114 family)